MKTHSSIWVGKLVLAAVVGAWVPACDRTATPASLASAPLTALVAEDARPVLAQAVEALMPPNDARTTEVDAARVREIHMPLAWIYARPPRAREAAGASDAHAALDHDLRPGA